MVSDEDDDFRVDVEERPSATRGKSRIKDFKGKGRSKGDPEKITAKNEGKPPSPAPAAEKKQPQVEDMDVDIIAAPPTPGLPPPDPPKKKLPTIKKKSKPDQGSATASPAPISKPKAAKAPPTNGAPSKKPTAPAVIQNPSGTTDFDLRDSSTWQTLIGKGPTNAGPKVGIEKRVSTEERRKQLDRMRDEARAQRNEEFKHTFDLQAPSLRIIEFERQLTQHHIKSYGPQVLGAAFKNRPIASRNSPADVPR